MWLIANEKSYVTHIEEKAVHRHGENQVINNLMSLKGMDDPVLPYCCL